MTISGLRRLGEQVVSFPLPRGALCVTTDGSTRKEDYFCSRSKIKRLRTYLLLTFPSEGDSVGSTGSLFYSAFSSLSIRREIITASPPPTPLGVPPFGLLCVVPEVRGGGQFKVVVPIFILLGWGPDHRHL